MRSKRFLCMRIELASACILLNRGIKSFGVKDFEPGTKPRQFSRGEPFDGFLDIFGGGHTANIAFASGEAKAADCEGRLQMPACAQPSGQHLAHQRNHLASIELNAAHDIGMTERAGAVLHVETRKAERLGGRRDLARDGFG